MNYGELKALIDAKKKSQVTTPVLVPDGSADGTMSLPVVKDAAVAEELTILCTTEGTAEVAKFSVTGAVSNLQKNELTSDCVYTTDDGLVSFLITAGDEDWDVGDVWTFTVSQDGDGLVDATKFRCIEFVRHSQADSVVVGYDADNNELRVVQQN